MPLIAKSQTIIKLHKVRPIDIVARDFQNPSRPSCKWGEKLADTDSIAGFEGSDSMKVLS